MACSGVNGWMNVLNVKYGKSGCFVCSVLFALSLCNRYSGSAVMWTPGNYGSVPDRGKILLFSKASRPVPV